MIAPLLATSLALTSTVHSDRRATPQVLVHSAGGEAAAAAAGLSTATIRRIIAENADSIWDRAACAAPVAATSPGSVMTTPPLFGDLWRGPCAWAFGGPTATTQTGAIDVFTAAAAVGGQ